MKSKENENDGSIWLTSDEAQKQEVLLAFEESENVENWVEAKAVFQKL